MKSKDIPIDISAVKGLIAKKAIESWRKLPPKTRSYIDIEDMISDGVFWTTKFLSKGHYDAKKGKLTTVLWIKLDNFYRRCAETLNAAKRFDGNVLLLEDLKAAGIDVSKDEEAPEICEHVRYVFLSTYEDASEGLRESMRRWFLQMDSTKVHTHSMRFKKDKSEFRQLAARHGLDVQDCRTLMNCTQIRNEVISRLPEFNFVEIK